jgi:hypothetical protein
MTKKAVIVNKIPFLLVKCSSRGYNVQNLNTKIWMKVCVRNEKELELHLRGI